MYPSHPRLDNFLSKIHGTASIPLFNRSVKKTSYFRRILFFIYSGFTQFMLISTWLGSNIIEEGGGGKKGEDWRTEESKKNNKLRDGMQDGNQEKHDSEEGTHCVI